VLFRLALLVIVDQIEAEAAPVAVFEEKPLVPLFAGSSK
jgi:hypothetical protein